MSDDKPMTVKERMAALARANSAPAPGPPKPAVASSGNSVADRLAKMRKGGSTTQGDSNHSVRGQGGSSIVDRIAKLSGSSDGPGSGSSKPAAGGSAGSTTTKSGQVFKGAGSTPVGDGNNGVKASGGMGRSPTSGGVGLPGMARAIPIPMPGAMPAGGLAELKWRKQKAERAASGAVEEQERTAPAAVADNPSEGQRPGELQHANMSRATISQRRRPRKATRPFKATAAADATSAAANAPRPATSAVEAAGSPTKPPSSVSESQAVPAMKKAEASTDINPTNVVDAVGKMKSMLQAAATVEKQEDGGDGEDDDADWE